jgi:hypothetical protein
VTVRRRTGTINDVCRLDLVQQRAARRQWRSLSRRLALASRQLINIGQIRPAKWLNVPRATGAAMSAVQGFLLGLMVAYAPSLIILAVPLSRPRMILTSVNLNKRPPKSHWIEDNFIWTNQNITWPGGEGLKNKGRSGSVAGAWDELPEPGRETGYV